jgi:hypothetical protein
MLKLIPNSTKYHQHWEKPLMSPNSYLIVEVCLRLKKFLKSLDELEKRLKLIRTRLNTSEIYLLFIIDGDFRKLTNDEISKIKQNTNVNGVLVIHIPQTQLFLKTMGMTDINCEDLKQTNQTLKALQLEVLPQKNDKIIHLQFTVNKLIKRMDQDGMRLEDYRGGLEIFSKLTKRLSELENVVKLQNANLRMQI